MLMQMVGKKSVREREREEERRNIKKNDDGVDEIDA